MFSLRVCTGVVAGLMVATGCTGAGTPVLAPTTSLADVVPDELAFVETEDLVDLRVALERPESLDPRSFDAGDQSAAVLIDLLFDGLTEVDGRTGSLRPGLASSWTSNSDFTRWAFDVDVLRTSAEEVKDSLDLVLRDGGLPAQLMGTVQAITVSDEGLVVIRLEEPNAGLPWILSGLGFSIANEELDPTGDFAPVSDDDRVLVLEAEEWLIEIIWLEPGERGQDLLDGEFADVSIVDAEVASMRIGDQLSLNASRFFVLNAASERLSDPLKREAVLASANRQQLAQSFEGPGADTDGLVSAGLAGFGPGACQWCDVSDERARDLAQVVPTVDALVVGHSATHTEVADALVAELSASGFEVSAVEFGSADFAVGVADGSIDIFTFGWSAPAGSLDAAVEPLLASWSATNVFGVGWSEVDLLLERARETGDDQERWALLREAEVEALSQSIAIPYGVASSQLAGVQAVNGLVVRADGSIDLDDLR